MTTKKTATKKTTRKTAAPKKDASAKATAKKAASKKPAASTNANKQMSALDAAAKVLGESKEPLNAKTLIERMAAKKYWTSPGGKTPHATLYTVVTMLPKLFSLLIG